MPAMPAKGRLLAVAAGLHLAIAAAFCTHVAIERSLPAFLARPMAIYSSFTGVPSHFNFFAPVVSPQARADFVLVARDGATRHVQLDAANFEAKQRLAMMFTFAGDAQARELLMRAWSVYMLTHHADAQAVEARLQVLSIPTLARAREGGRTQWVEVARTSMRREELSGS